MSRPASSPWPLFTREEADAASSVLSSNRVNHWTGQQGREFECAFASFAVALANDTVALDVALKALAAGPGDEMAVMRRTFLASVSAPRQTDGWRTIRFGIVGSFARSDPEFCHERSAYAYYH